MNRLMQESLSPLQRHRLGILFIVGCALLACHVLWLPRIIVDDAFISYRYADHLLSGDGLVFNPSERVEGFSNPLWVLLTAVGMLGRLDPVDWTRAMGAAALLGSLIVAVYLARRLIGSAWAALGVGLVLAASTAMCGAAMSGLETGLFTLLVTAALACAAVNRLWWCSFVIGLAALTRPEGAGLCVVGIVVIALMHKGADRNRRVLAMLLPCAAVVAALLTARLAYYGAWLPNSAQAKSAMLPLLNREPVIHWPRIIFNAPGLDYVLGFVRYAFGPLMLLAMIPVLRSDKNRPVAAFMLGALGMGIAVALYNFGDWMSCFRLLVPYLPITTVLVVWGMADVLSWVQRRLQRPWQGPCKIAVMGLILWIAAGQFQRDRPLPGQTPDRELAALLNQSHQPGLLAATDVLGRLSYYARNVRVLDMAGLTDLHIAEHGKPSPPFGRTDFAYVLSRRPQFIMNNVRSAWARRLDMQEFTDHYWWIDRPTWTHPKDPAAKPRYVFVRRGTILETELRRRYPAAAFRPPTAIAAAPFQTRRLRGTKTARH